MNTDSPKTIVKVGSLTVTVVKKNIKNLHLAVLPPNGTIRVTAPLKMDEEAIRLLISSRIGWIKKQQVKFKEQIRQTEREFISGETHYYLGKKRVLIVVNSETGNKITLKGQNQIILQVKTGIALLRKSELLDTWYRRELRGIIGQLIPKWEKETGQKYDKVGIKKMKTKWGTCNPESMSIWLNLELIKKPKSCIEYLFVHEICHFKERKHDQNFVVLMDKYLPKWRSLKEELNRLPLTYQDWKY